MNYTFLADKDVVLRQIKKITSEYSDIVEYDLEESSIKDVIIDINTISLFSKKVLVVFNIEKIDDIDILSKYLDNTSDNILILCSFKSLNTKLNNLLKNKTKYFEMFKYDLNKYVKENLEDFSMDTSSINLLISYCENDIGRVSNELEKLKLYKISEKQITSNDIKKIVKKSFSSTIFNLIDSINYREKNSIYTIYNELLKQGETNEKILYTIANHYRLLYKIRKKLEIMSEEEVIKEFKLHPYRLKKIKEQFNMISEKENLLFLKRLSDIDIDIKSGKKSSDIGLFMFFENL